MPQLLNDLFSNAWVAFGLTAVSLLTSLLLFVKSKNDAKRHEEILTRYVITVRANVTVQQNVDFNRIESLFMPKTSYPVKLIRAMIGRLVRPANPGALSDKPALVDGLVRKRRSETLSAYANLMMGFGAYMIYASVFSVFSIGVFLFFLIVYALLFTNQKIFEWRVYSGKYGMNTAEAREFIQYILDNADDRPPHDNGKIFYDPKDELAKEMKSVSLGRQS